MIKLFDPEVSAPYDLVMTPVTTTAPPPTPSRTESPAAIAAAFYEAYLADDVANAAGFLAAGIAYLTMLNRAVTTLAALVGRQQMALEARLFTAANIVLLMLPFVAALGYIVLRAVSEESGLLDELRKLVERVSLLGAMVVLLPVSLTLALVWAAKDTLVQELVSRGDRSAREPVISR